MKNPLYTKLLNGSKHKPSFDHWYSYMNKIRGPYNIFQNKISTKKWKGIVPDEQKLCRYMDPPSFERMINDSAKLKYLDKLLYDKKIHGHRVLIFCQMTRMMNILEEYLARRHYSYFRLDGNSNISERN